MLRQHLKMWIPEDFSSTKPSSCSLSSVGNLAVGAEFTFSNDRMEQIFGNTDTGCYKPNHLSSEYIYLLTISIFCFTRHNLVTFNQATWTSILVIGFHLVKSLAIYPLFSSLSPRDTFVMNIILVSLATILENVAIPTYWFYSSYINYHELWSSANMFYRIKKTKKAFYITDNFRPRIERNKKKITLRKQPSKAYVLTNIFSNVSHQVDVEI